MLNLVGFCRLPLRVLLTLVAALAVIAGPCSAPAQTTFAPIPAEVSSTHFTVTINGATTPVVHAAAAYYLLNFDLSGPVTITITADDLHYWDRGVEVQPMRFGIRPRRTGASISFALDQPAKLSITRPGDHFGDSEMLFLFANPPDNTGITAATPGVRYYAPGVYRGNIDAHAGDHIYLAAGAVVFGGLNIWQVQDVHVSGRGMLIYDGPQDPNDDTGWFHKPGWHAIVMDDSYNIDIEGITAVVRSRTWMNQMRGSHHVTFRNIKEIGGTAGNANQDGMDWLGGSDTLIDDSFFRASDDIFAVEGNWDGYAEEAMVEPGQPVRNITVENSTLSTSISNIVRVNWPKKSFNSDHFTLRNSDVIHMGMGSCNVPFALLEVWADPQGSGTQSNYRLEDIRLEDWYSLVQLRQPKPEIRNITFTNIAAMDGPGMVPSAFKGAVEGVTFDGVDLGSGDVTRNSDIPLQILDGAGQPTYKSADQVTGFTYSAGILRPGKPVTFTAAQPGGADVHWLFGDGSSADGPQVEHVFPDAEGTLLDGTGRFRVLLATTDQAGTTRWNSQSVVVAQKAVAAERHARRPVAQGLSKLPVPGGSYEGLLRVPHDGGYTLTLLTSTTGSLTIGGVHAESAKLRAQVCGSEGAAVQAVRVSAVLKAGLHPIKVMRGTELENAQGAAGPQADPVLLWEGPGFLRQPIPASALGHRDE